MIFNLLVLTCWIGFEFAAQLKSWINPPNSFPNNLYAVTKLVQGFVISFDWNFHINFYKAAISKQLSWKGVKSLSTNLQIVNYAPNT